MSFSRSARTVAICRALRSSATTKRVSPAWGTPERPRISTGSAGPACCVFLPRSLNIARTRPDCEPTTTASPSLSVPAWIEGGGHRTAAAVEPAFHDDPARGAVRVGLELEDLGLERGHLEELRDAVAALRRGVHEDGLPAPVLGHEPVVGQLALHPIRLGAGLVDLVHRHDDRHLGGLGVVHRLDRLRHHAVVGRHHQDDDVGRLGAARAHGREGLVARRVEEGHLAVRSCPPGRRRCAA